MDYVIVDQRHHVAQMYHQTTGQAQPTSYVVAAMDK